MAETPADNTPNRRHFSRFPLDGSVVLLDADKRQWQGSLHDICLKGALIGLPADWQGERGQHGELHIRLANGEVEITMHGHITHIEADSGGQTPAWNVGFSWDQLDLDSATHLHRLVELNLGDTRLLQRELAELLTPR